MPIAIVGMSCRLPGSVSSPSEFWELCARARSGYTPTIPSSSRFSNATFQHPNPDKAGCYNPVGGHFIDHVDLAAFDAPFFSLTEKEVVSMDPQQRLLLECTFEALENAGMPRHGIVGGEVGVFIGGSFPEYEAQLFRDSERIPIHQATGCAYAMQSNRISHFFDLKGPSFTTDTACSSSLVAMHQACQSLRVGESSMAIVGGCHLNTMPEFWISFSKSRLFSDSGRSFSFDNRGTGFGRGEGCGMVILKPLEEARRNNDSIRAVIVGSGVNQDGRTPGITMPCGTAQETLMRQVYTKSGLDPNDTGFIEAHGTGTRVGDPIEATAIHNVFGTRTLRDPLYLGSVKSNIGHLEGASGVIAVIKAAMMLERGFILPNYDFKHPNEKIPFAKWHMKVPTSQRPWPRTKKYISVNNFGFGGTNAHVVLERIPFVPRNNPKSTDLYSNKPDEEDNPNRKLFVLTANDKLSLEAVMQNLVIYLEQRPEMFQKDLMGDVAYTLGQRRSLLPWRVAIPALRSFDLIEALSSGQKVVPAKTLVEPLRVGFIFTGQGAQWYRMGRELYEQYPVFTRAMDWADRCLARLGAEWSLIEELGKDENTSVVGAAHISQPSCTAIQLALVDLLRSWGIHPAAVAGHSSGEIGAAYAANILPFESCMSIAYHRGRLIPVLKERYPDLKGAMMAVGGNKEDFESLLSQVTDGEVRIACYNSPSSLTISGDEAGIDQLKSIVEEKQLFNRKLFVDTAYHSHHMNLIAKDYQQSIADTKPPISTETRFYSSLVGRPIDGKELETSYWVQNLTCPVRFSEAVQSILEPIGEHRIGINMLLELGPHAALQGPLKQILKAVGGDAAKIPYATLLSRKKDAVETAMDVAATLFTKGATLNFEAVNFAKPGNNKPPILLTDLPRYPWNHSAKYWHESRLTKKQKDRGTRNDILGTLANYSNDLEPTWRNIVRLDDLPWLEHHKIQSLTIFPMSGYLSMALEAAAQRAAAAEVEYDRYLLRDVSVVAPLVISDEDVEMTTNLRPHQEGTLLSSDTWDEFRICSWTTIQGWKEHCKGLIAVQGREDNGVDDMRQAHSSQALLRSAKFMVDNSVLSTLCSENIYKQLLELGVAYGPTFQCIADCRASNSGSKAELTVPDVAKEMPNHYLSDSILQPALLESLISMYWPIASAGINTVETLDTIYLPSSVERITISRDVTEATKEPGKVLAAYCQGKIPRVGPRPTKVSMIATAADNTSEPLIALENLTIAPILEHNSEIEEGYRELCYKLDWEPILESTDSDASTQELADAEVAIIHAHNTSQQQLASSLSSKIERLSGKKPNTSNLLESSTEGKLCIVLSELEKPLLSTLQPDEFEALQRVLTSVRGVLWVIRGSYDTPTSPDLNMIAGLSRTIRSETLLPFATLDLDGQTQLPDTEIPDAVLKVFKDVFRNPRPNQEMEFTERCGKFFTARIVDDEAMNALVHRETQASALLPTKFVQDERPLKMQIANAGALDTLYFTDAASGSDDVTRDLPLAPDEIEISVQAIGVNHRDLTTAHGKLPNSDFGIECSGTITAIGAKVSHLSTGDRVAALTLQPAFATTTRTRSSFAIKLPHDMSFQDGATLPLAYSTAYHSLLELARLHDSERVLIHAAAGAVGQAAICLSQMIGAEVFATVGSASKKEFLMQEFHIPEDHIFYSRNAAFGRTLRQIMGDGSGVDVVLNCLSGDALGESWDCLNRFGRLVDIGTREAGTSTRLEMVQSQGHNASFLSVDIMASVAERPRVMGRLMAEVADLVKYRKIRPVAPVTVFAISEVEAAFKRLHSAKGYGKVVVVPGADDVVQATRPKRPRQLLKEDATYILIGGTGGLGRSMARWMVGRGARHLVLVSRSGSATGKVKELIEEVAQEGAEVAVHRCDVANASEVENLVQSLQEMPPVRGLVHGAMVLHDVLFEKMTYEQYATVTASKVAGAWNFHRALLSSSLPLDFFIAVSSAAGAVGNRGQAAYAAANTFLNALVQHRLSLSLPASSLDLTAVSDTGYLAEDAAKAAEVAKNLGGDTICEAEVLALLGAAIDGTLESACNNHVITGMRITNFPSAPPFWTGDAKFKHLRLAAEKKAAEEADASAGDRTKAVQNWKAALKGAKELAEAEQVVCDGLVHKLAAVMMVEEKELDVTRSLSYYPLDSLVAIEIRNFITREFETTLQVLELLSSGSIQTLAKAVCVKSKLVNL
ncbi:putative polyketide synthase [Pseudomassariella vexata]|uniref:Putative polyketide synthase n=1 Tax=Pseudomassariella vexata TaxID=1141098 RepID=A0A1Y2DX68_9PEZI|nr:putative polyketide synthase [Pseudomassariella vexata]ORY63888.1 putative polyketide synthase [Pseudomassariella vexata]